MENPNTALAPWERELLGLPKVWMNITLKMVILGMLDIIERFGEEHSPRDNDRSGMDGCVYATKVKSNALVPVCIVGQFLSDLGILGLTLPDPDSKVEGICSPHPVNAGNLRDLRPLLAKRGVVMSDGAFMFLDRAQGIQDNALAGTWGKAVEGALALVVDEGLIGLPEQSFIERAKAWQELL